MRQISSQQNNKKNLVLRYTHCRGMHMLGIISYLLVNLVHTLIFLCVSFLMCSYELTASDNHGKTSWDNTATYYHNSTS